MELFIYQSGLQKTRTRNFIIVTFIGILGIIGWISYGNYSFNKQNLLIMQYELDLQEFKRFLFYHNKLYRSAEEFSYRFQVFQDNIALIRSHNSLGSSVILSANKFADLTHEEFKDKYTQVINKAPKEPTEIYSGDSVPPAVDWRDLGAVTDVENQTPYCKASWAFASVGAIEGIWQISKNPLIDLSVQQILDCQESTGSHGCEGGNDDDAFLYAMDNGLTSDIIYPYIHTNETCKAVAPNQIITKISNYTDITPRDGGSIVAAVSIQPVVAGVESDQYVWQFYQQGIITKFCGQVPNHYILIVGYNLTDNSYVCKNSWGSDWGESGYVRINIGTGGGPGTCGIQTLISYPNITNT